MRRAIVVAAIRVLLLLFCGTSWNVVQAALCPSPANPGPIGMGPFLDISPVTPTSAQTFVISAGHISYDPVSLTTSVQGTTINATFTAIPTGVGVPPPLACASATVGPVPPGIYTIKVYLVTTNPVLPPVLDSSVDVMVVRPLNISSSTSPTGTTILRLFGPFWSACILPDQTTYSVSNNSISLATTTRPTPTCFGVPPPGAVDVSVDIGVLPPAHYNVAWTYGGALLTTAEFDVTGAAGPTDNAIPTLSLPALVALALVVASIGAVTYRRQPSRME